MKKPIKRLLIISQVLGWSALAASACTDNDQQNKTGSTSTIANADQNNSPKDDKNKGELSQQPEKTDNMKNNSAKGDEDQHHQSGTVSESESSTANNITTNPGSKSEGSKSQSPKMPEQSQGDSTVHSETDHHGTSDSNDGDTTMESQVPKKQVKTADGGEGTTSMSDTTSENEGHGKKTEGEPNQVSSQQSSQTEDESTPGPKGQAGAEHHSDDSEASSESSTVQK